MSDTVELDACGLLCPLPVIRTQDAIKQLHTGDTLIVRATDPGTQQDIPAWCSVHGHTLSRIEVLDEVILFEIQVAQ